MKVKVEKVQVKFEDAGVKMEGHADDADGCDAFQYMSQECCVSVDLSAKPSKKTQKVDSYSSSTRKSLSGTTSKAKTMKTAVSVNIGILVDSEIVLSTRRRDYLVLPPCSLPPSPQK